MKRILLLLLTIAIGEDAYAYDTAGRLISATTHPTVGGAARTETFTYDAFGNRTGDSVDGVSHPVGVDPANNRLVGATYDVVGNMTEGVMSGVWGSRTYRYDALSRMTAVGQGSFQRRMLYDASDERIATVVDDSLTRWTLRDLQGRLLREYHSDSGGTWIWESDYVHAGGQLVAGETQPYLYQDEGGTWAYGGERHYHLDHLGSVRLVTDWAGRSLTEHDYAPFGVTTTKTYQEPSVPSGHVDAMRYAGHWRDFLGWENVDNTEYLDYMHARYYDPNLGRFLSVDPMLGDPRVPQSWNRYAYVINSPINNVDPSGMKPCDAAVIATLPEGIVCEQAEATADPPPSDSMNLFLAGMGGSRALDRLSSAVPFTSRDASNFVAGFGNGVSLGITDQIQDMWDEAVWNGESAIDEDSLAYDTGLKWGWVWQTALQIEGGRTGYEFTFGENVRVAPWGNRTGDPLGKYPHYHRRIVGPDGKTVPGGAIGRHRPCRLLHPVCHGG